MSSVVLVRFEWSEPGPATAGRDPAAIASFGEWAAKPRVERWVRNAGAVAVEQGWRVGDEVVRARFDFDTDSLDVRRSPVVARAPVPGPIDDLRLTGRWPDADRESLAVALATLEPDARAVIEGSRWHYHRTRRRGTTLGQTRLFAAPLRFDVWSGLFVDDEDFVFGPDDALVPFAAYALVHEVGHAVDRGCWFPGRRVVRGSPPGPARRAARRCARADAWHPARAELLDVAGRVRWSPTHYGTTDGREAFAEAFALWTLDPAWLRASAPDVADWFAAGRHLAFRAQLGNGRGTPPDGE